MSEYERMTEYRLKKEAEARKEVLDAITQGRETGYAFAIEEAAKVCDAEWQGTSSLCRSKCAGDLAKRIRALLK